MFPLSFLGIIMPFNEKEFNKTRIKYGLNIFVETGSHFGQTIEWARKKFKEVYSIDIDWNYYQYCMCAFKGADNVNLYLGDSGEILGDVLEKVKGRAMIWLDAHLGEGDCKKVPLIEELKFIKNHPIKNHIILIDDIRLVDDKAKDDWRNITIDKLKKAIFDINKNYKITIDDDRLKAEVD